MGTSTASIVTARGLACVLRAAGYVRGLPRAVGAAAAAIDRGLCRRCVCPGCGRQGLEFRPWHRGGSYRVVSACRECGAAEEL
jgi:hypothetical protein